MKNIIQAIFKKKNNINTSSEIENQDIEIKKEEAPFGKCYELYNNTQFYFDSYFARYVIAVPVNYNYREGLKHFFNPHNPHYYFRICKHIVQTTSPEIKEPTIVDLNYAITSDKKWLITSNDVTDGKSAFSLDIKKINIKDYTIKIIFKNNEIQELYFQNKDYSNYFFNRLLE